MTAAQAKYNAHQASIRSLIKQLEAKLDNHEKQASAHPANWGFSGDLGHVEANLTELVEFFR
jgi:hypothetical protein